MNGFQFGKNTVVNIHIENSKLLEGSKIEIPDVVNSTKYKFEREMGENGII